MHKPHQAFPAGRSFGLMSAVGAAFNSIIPIRALGIDSNFWPDTFK
jgi:hypothetical protein